MSKLFQKVANGLVFKPQSAAPSDPENGAIYYDSTLTKFRKYQNGAWTDLDTTGGATMALFKVRKSTGQSITSGSTIQITWAAANVDYDTASGFSDSNDNYVVPTTGYYRISALMYSPADGNGSRILLYKINGTGAEHYLQRIHGSGDQDSHWGGSAPHKLNSGDTIAIYVSQNSGSTLSMGGDPDSVFFSVEQIG